MKPSSTVLSRIYLRKSLTSSGKALLICAISSFYFRNSLVELLLNGAFPQLLAEKLECTLLGLVACLEQPLQCLLARRVLLAAHDATLLGLHQVLLGEPTGSVLSSPVVDLGLCAHSGHLLASATHHRGVVLTRAGVHLIFHS